MTSEKTFPYQRIMEEGLQCILTFDAAGNPLEGGKNYKFHLSPNIPASDFWSVIVYDNQTRLIISTDQKWPSVFSNCQSLKINQDGSVDIWLGPKAPVDKNFNWIQTIPGKNWNMILRLYNPTDSWYNKTWRLGEIEEIKLIV